MLAAFNETHVSTSKKYVAEQYIVMSNWLSIFESFWSDSSLFALEKRPKKLVFQRFFISKIPFAGYFQWNECA